MSTSRSATAAAWGSCVTMTTDRRPDSGRLAQQPEDFLAVGRVEVAGRLVAQDRFRIAHQGAGDGDALHLAAGHFLGKVAGAAAHADAFQALGRVLERLAAADAAQQQRQRHVLHGRQRRQQVEELEDEADARPAQVRAFAVGEGVEVFAVETRRGRWSAYPGRPSGASAWTCRSRSVP